MREFLIVLAFSIAALSTLQAAPLSFKQGQTRWYGNVKSLHEIRWDKLTRQGWDISCGAAALSTLLTYHNNRPFSEMAITLTILKNGDPELVRERGGFSLFDLKRFVNAIGLQGLGYGEMTVDDLETFSVPAILPIRIKDFDHFVIFRQRLGDHVLLGDPAFGNLSFPVERFQKMWKSRIAFYVVTEQEQQLLAEHGHLNGRSQLSANAMEVAIPNPVYTPRMLSRIPLTPMTRKFSLPSP